MSPIKRILRRKVKNLQQKLSRREKRITSFKDLIVNLKRKLHVSGEVSRVLQDNFNGFPLEMLMHEHKYKDVKKEGVRYSKTMKDFAKTVFFYSPKAYNYLRKKFLLPHPGTISKWVNSIKCEPGLLSEVFDFLKLQVKTNSWLQNCVLCFDSMSIRQQVVWDPAQSKYSGYVNYAGMVEENNDVATEVLVVMLVALQKNFKCPLAYFFVNKISGYVQATVIKTIVTQLHNIGIKIWSITCDGARSNISCFKILGCNFNKEDGNRFYHTPSKTHIFVMFDACHMLKLARNLLAQNNNISSPYGLIQFKYIVNLNEIQQDLGLTFANKLTSRHVNFQNNVMKVKIAAQTLSSSVADAIEFLNKKNDVRFAGSEGTVIFIRTIDRLFDLLNTRNLFDTGFKRPINYSNFSAIEASVTELLNNIKCIQVDGVNILKHARHMFALGFITTAKSFLDIARELLFTIEPKFNFVLSYKFSQDHLELFFSSVRCRNGWNNNPNCLQFKWTLRKLLFT